MLENLEKMSKEDAQKRLKELNREIRKHEIAFLAFITIAIVDIVLTIAGFMDFGVLTFLTVIGCSLACYGIFKYSEPYEVEKSLIQLIISLTDEK